MDYLQKFISQVRRRLLTILLFNNLILLADWWLADEVFKLAGWWLFIALFLAPVLSAGFLPWAITKALTQPTKIIWQAILHIAPDAGDQAVAAPDLKSARLGRDLVRSLVAHVYRLASVANNIDKLTAGHDVKDSKVHKPHDPQTAHAHGTMIIVTNREQRQEVRADIEKRPDGYIVTAKLTPREFDEFLRRP